MNIEEIKTVKSHLIVVWFFSLNFLLVRGEEKKTEWLQNHPDTEKR